MSFFSEVDAFGIVENHIQQVRKLEDDETKRMLSTYKELRRELRDRIDSIPGETFTAQQLRGYLVQVDGAIIAMANSLSSDMAESVERALEKSITDTTSEINKFEREFTGAVTPLSIDRLLIISDTKNLLASQHESSLQAYSQDIRQNVVRLLTESQIAGRSTGTASRRLSQFFIGEEWKLHRLVRTELHNVYNKGKLKALSETKNQNINDLKKTLVHPMDSRTSDDSKELAKLNPIVDLDKAFVQNFNGRTYTFMTPPNRPNDRAILIPYRVAWDKSSNQRESA